VKVEAHSDLPLAKNPPPAKPAPSPPVAKPAPAAAKPETPKPVPGDAAPPKAAETPAAAVSAAPPAPKPEPVPVAPAPVEPVAGPRLVSSKPQPAPTAANSDEPVARTSPAGTANGGASDLAGIGETVAEFLRGESAAALAHLKALSAARTPAEVLRLQVGEFQRAADASLTVWSDIARRTSRLLTTPRG